MKRIKKRKENFGAKIAKRLQNSLFLLEDKKGPKEEKIGKLRELISLLEFIVEGNTDEEIIADFYRELNKIFSGAKEAVSLELAFNEIFSIIEYKATWRVILDKNQIVKIEEEKTVKRYRGRPRRPQTAERKHKRIYYKNDSVSSFFNGLKENSLWFKNLDYAAQELLKENLLSKVSQTEHKIIALLPYLWRGGISEKGLYEAEQIIFAVNQTWEFIEETDKQKFEEIIVDLTKKLQENFLLEIIKETEIFNKENLLDKLEAVLKSFLTGKLEKITSPEISKAKENLFQILESSLAEALVKKIFTKQLNKNNTES